MTPAEELRAAAATIRTRAEAATPGPWGRDDEIPNVVYSDVRAGRTVARTDLNVDAPHLAMWSPPVALAVAALLDEHALDITGLSDQRGESLARDVLPIARLINRGAP